MMDPGMGIKALIMSTVLQGMRSDFQALDRVNAAQKAASLAFPTEGSAIKEMNPEAAPAAHEAESNAADHAQVSTQAVFFRMPDARCFT